MSQSLSYADAGVSIDNANRAVAKIREFARSTFNERTLTEIGTVLARSRVLVDARWQALEAQAEALEERAPIRGGGGQHQPAGAQGRPRFPALGRDFNALNADSL